MQRALVDVTVDRRRVENGVYKFSKNGQRDIHVVGRSAWTQT